MAGPLGALALAADAVSLPYTDMSIPAVALR
jgi:hypothetical protein